MVALILIILGLLIIFQLTLIFGAPLGRYAWGGQHRRLPRQLRIGSSISIVLYIGMALTALEAGRFTMVLDPGLTDVLTWIIVVYLGIGVMLNALSRSRPERYTMTPIALTLCLSYLALAV